MTVRFAQDDADGDGVVPAEIRKNIDKTKKFCYNEKNFASSPNRKGFLATIMVNVQKHSGRQETMENSEILQYYDDLMRLAASKCHVRADAEDLVGDVMLAAFAYMHGGGVIEHPKTWLTNTLYHKYNDQLRKKYRTPMTVCLDEALQLGEQETDAFLCSEEAANLRKELNHLAYVTREVLIRHYFGNQSVSQIAAELGVPEGTVKYRLSAGRDQIKKGLESMETKENYLPGSLDIMFGGAEGANHEPVSLVENDLIAQNLLMIAYEKPLTISELSKAIGIPAAYIEPIIDKLIDGELMARTDSGRVYTDFIIYKPQDTAQHFDKQLAFAHKHFDTIWGIVQGMIDQLAKASYVQNLGVREKVKLERYAVLKVLQDFEYEATGQLGSLRFPERKDGGRWIAQGNAYEAGFNPDRYREANQYVISGGHRWTEAVSHTPEGQTKRLCLHEFDTTLFDSPHRFGDIYDLYFKHIVPLLWSIYNSDTSEQVNIPNQMIEYIPMFETLGLIKREDGVNRVAIPVLTAAEYGEFAALLHETTALIDRAIGDEFRTFIVTMKTPIPKHLTSVPKLYQYTRASIFFVMSIVREAYEKGLHLQGVDYCCPPVVLVFEE